MPDFLDVYLGDGMRELWKSSEPPSAISLNGVRQDSKDLVQPRNRSRKSSVF